ncbi:MAG: hypothetical protein RIC95_03600 [Vicingaceae bacterium]
MKTKIILTLLIAFGLSFQSCEKEEDSGLNHNTSNSVQKPEDVKSNKAYYSENYSEELSNYLEYDSITITNDYSYDDDFISMLNSHLNSTNYILSYNDLILNDITVYHINSSTKAFALVVDDQNYNMKLLIKTNISTGTFTEVESKLLKVEENSDDSWNGYIYDQNNNLSNTINFNGTTLSSQESELAKKGKPNNNLKVRDCPGDDFGDCVVHTFTDFASDLLGLAVSVVSPTSVLAASAIDCGFICNR